MMIMMRGVVFGVDDLTNTYLLQFVSTLAESPRNKPIIDSSPRHSFGMGVV